MKQPWPPAECPSTPPLQLVCEKPAAVPSVLGMPDLSPGAGGVPSSPVGPGLLRHPPRLPGDGAAPALHVELARQGRSTAGCAPDVEARRRGYPRYNSSRTPSSTAFADIYAGRPKADARANLQISQPRSLQNSVGMQPGQVHVRRACAAHPAQKTTLDLDSSDCDAKKHRQ